MNETNTTTTTTTTKKPRTIDPAIEKLRQEHRDNVAYLKKSRESASILSTIIEKRLPALTPEDRLKLLAAIGPKPVNPAPTAPAPRPAQPTPVSQVPPHLRKP